MPIDIFFEQIGFDVLTVLISRAMIIKHYNIKHYNVIIKKKKNAH